MSKEKVPYIWWFPEDRFLTEKNILFGNSFIHFETNWGMEIKR